MNSKVFTSKQAFRVDGFTVEVGNLDDLAGTQIRVRLLEVTHQAEINLRTWKELVAKVDEAIKLSDENFDDESRL